MSNQQWDDCFCLQLPIKKVEQIYFLTASTLLILHVPSLYSVVEIEDRNKHQIVKQGKIQPPVLEKLCVYDHKSIIYNVNSQLHLFDLLQGRSICRYAIPQSEIYEQQFEFQVCPENSSSKIVFFKSSILKSTPITIYYDVHLLDVGSEFTREKRSKTQHQDLRKFGYCSGQLFSYQISGYTIEINFIDSGIFHKINSIFHMFLVEITYKADCMIFNFTHEDLEYQLTSYEVSKKRVKKIQRKVCPFQPHVFYNSTSSRSVIYKNFFNRKKRDSQTGIFRIKFQKSVKYLKMLDHVMPDQTEKSFKQQVLNLLL